MNAICRRLPRLNRIDVDVAVPWPNYEEWVPFYDNCFRAETLSARPDIESGLIEVQIRILLMSRLASAYAHELLEYWLSQKQYNTVVLWRMVPAPGGRRTGFGAFTPEMIRLEDNPGDFHTDWGLHYDGLHDRFVVHPRGILSNVDSNMFSIEEQSPWGEHIRTDAPGGRPQGG